MESLIKKNVAQIFRKPTEYFFSIENVFSSSRPFISKVKISVFSVKKQGVRISNFLQLRKHKHKFELFHITGDIHYAVFAFPRNRVVLTIHDCVFLKNYSGIKKWALKKILLEWPARYARTITTISEKSKAEILLFSGCNPEKVRIIPNPVQPIFKFSEKEFNGECPRILFLGKTPNKNLDRVIEVLTGIPCLLNIVGVPTAEQYRSLEGSNIKYFIESGLSDAEIANRYEQCDILLFPSWYEGFGLPIIEAFQTGRVVVTSNISPMREVADGGAVLVDPFSVESIKEGIQRIICDKELRGKLIERGRVVVQRYHADHIAKMYEDLYLELL